MSRWKSVLWLHENIVMLLVYSSDLHLFISPVYNGDFLIQPSNVSLSPGTYEVTPFAAPANATVEIVAVVWGLGHITNPDSNRFAL